MNDEKKEGRFIAFHHDKCLNTDKIGLIWRWWVSFHLGKLRVATIYMYKTKRSVGFDEYAIKYCLYHPNA
jgi:hypothetical protein